MARRTQGISLSEQLDQFGLDSQDNSQRKLYIKTLLSYWRLLGNGPESLDEKNKNDVRIAQEVLSTAGYYKGEIDGKYSPIVDQARWSWIQDIQQDPDFSWELIKSRAEEIFGNTKQSNEGDSYA